MLAGAVPFTGKNVTEVLYKHMTDTPPDLQKLRPDAPEHLVAIINKCLEKDPAKRWDNMREAMRALRQP